MNREISEEAWWWADDIDGQGRTYRVVRKAVVIGRCPNISGCFITRDGSHTQHIVFDARDIPPPKYEKYFYFRDEREDK